VLIYSFTDIANPIHLARLILEHSTKPLSLRRVPPNLLVGQGATDFAFECGMPVLPNDFLVSPGAKERWNRWNQDLKQARHQEEEGENSDWSEITAEDDHSRSSSRPAYSHQLSGLRNESQPYSPQLTPTASSDEESSTHRRAKSPGPRSYTPSHLHEINPAFHQLYMDSSPSPKAFPHGFSIPSPQGNDGHSSHRQIGTNTAGPEDDEDDEDESGSFIDSDPKWVNSAPPTASKEETDPKNDQDPDMSKSVGNISIHSETPSLPAESQLDGEPASALEAAPGREDQITDTVGAIAVDCYGNIAAGSSSGGIGMKHKGRTGPAALVGTGTSVIPIEPDDKQRTCVAAVTSGTGEHMATTSASNACATRLYYNQMKGKRGEIVSTDEESAIRSFVEKDFMGRMHY